MKDMTINVVTNVVNHIERYREDFNINPQEQYPLDIISKMRTTGRVCFAVHVEDTVVTITHNAYVVRNLDHQEIEWFSQSISAAIEHTPEHVDIITNADLHYLTQNQDLMSTTAVEMCMIAALFKNRTARTADTRLRVDEDKLLNVVMQCICVIIPKAVYVAIKLTQEKATLYIHVDDISQRTLH